MSTPQASPSGSTRQPRSKATVKPARMSRIEMDALDSSLLARGLFDFGITTNSAGANVIMQLAYPPVGYGVSRSSVIDGRADMHPIKRGRTTLTYIAVAVLGTAEDRRRYRQAVNRQHAQVRSAIDSPVEYNAMDPTLQLWVAACLYYGIEDLYERVHGKLIGDERHTFYRQGMVLGTTLQMPAEAWPETRADFDTYWNSMLPQLSISDEVRENLIEVASQTNLPRLMRQDSPHIALSNALGFLPPEIRELMRIPWTRRDQERFDAVVARAAEHARTRPLWRSQFVSRAMLADVRMRMRLGMKLV